MLDVVVKNGLIIDGTMAAPYRGSILIESGRICGISSHLRTPQAHRLIDATDHWVTPGFIDMHGHNDVDIIEQPLCEDKICQGVTTQTVGHCGASAAPLDPQVPVGTEAILPDARSWRSFSEYLRAISSAHPATHVAAFVGYSNLRSIARIEGSSRAAWAGVQRMCTGLENAMEAGAFGLTTGLTYPPQTSASTQEIIELCRIVAAYDGLYATHIRHNTDEVSLGVEEAIRIATESGVRTHIAHLQFRRSDIVAPVVITRRIQQAREGGIELTCDQYPYLAGLGPISPFFPDWVFDEDLLQAPQQLRTSATRERIAEHMRNAVEPFVHWHEILIQNEGARSPMKNVQEIAQAAAASPSDILVDYLLSTGANGTCLIFGKRQQDLEMLAKCPYCAIGSDGSQRTLPVHPRTYGTFVRFLRMFAVTSSCLSPQEAVHRMTKLPAGILGLSERGAIELGKAADVLVMDPATLDDRATYDNPLERPVGIDYVLVDGTVVLDSGIHTEARPGGVLASRQGKQT